MKRIILLYFLCITFNTDITAQAKDSSRIKLEESINMFYSAIERGDALARVALLDTDAILMPNGNKLICGKDNVAVIFTSDTADYLFRLKDRIIVDMNISDSIAYTVNSYYYTWHKKGNPPNWRKTKNVHIWRKDNNGNWKLRVDIWNSDTSIEFKEK